MFLKKFESSDYNELCEWWAKHYHPQMDYSILPQGFIISDEGKNLAMSFVYLMDGCNVAQIAWTTTNPEISLRKRYEAVNELTDAMLVYINNLQIKHVMCFTDSSGLAKLYNKKGLRLGNYHNLCIGSF